MVFHSSCWPVSNGSSQSTQSCHSDCMNILALTVTGLPTPKGLNSLQVSFNTSCWSVQGDIHSWHQGQLVCSGVAL